jgi:hypothetical protein
MMLCSVREVLDGMPVTAPTCVVLPEIHARGGRESAEKAQVP